MRVTVDDVTLEVHVEGRADADAAPIVLLHGFPFSRALWDAQVPQLAARARIVRVDLRGMGASQAGDGPYLMESLAGDVAGVLDRLKMERVTLVGHSLGGYVAMAFCRMYAERVARLALVCSRLAADTAAIAAAREALADRIEREDRIDAVLDAYLPKEFALKSLSADPRLLERARTIASENTPRGLAAMLRGMAQRVASDDIAQELTMPVVAIAGALDAVVPIDEAREMTRVFPNARLETMERSGHLPMLEEPERLTRALLDFATG